MNNQIESIKKEFREKSMQIVSYSKWSDEDIAQFTGEELVWKDEFKNNPNNALSLLDHLLDSKLSEVRESVIEDLLPVHDDWYCSVHDGDSYRMKCTCDKKKDTNRAIYFYLVNKLEELKKA